jgi:cytosine/adenosine deaminase-related metal-dependent hydrolase
MANTSTPWPDPVLDRHAIRRVVRLIDEPKKADLILLRADALNIAPLNVPAGQIVLAAQPRNIDSVWVDGIARKPPDRKGCGLGNQPGSGR